MDNPFSRKLDLTPPDWYLWAVSITRLLVLITAAAVLGSIFGLLSQYGD